MKIFVRLLWHKVGDGSAIFAENKLLTQAELNVYKNNVNKIFGDNVLSLVVENSLV